MNVGISTSVIQRGRTGIAQYVFALVRALARRPDGLRIHLLVLEEDRPLFEDVADRVTLVPVSERHRSALRNILWHQTVLPGLARRLGLDVLHTPSYRRLVWSARLPRVGTIHDLAPFHVTGKYDPLRMFYGRQVVRRLARRQDAVIAVSGRTAADLKQHFGLGSDRVTVIWNGLDHDRFHPGDPAAAREEARRLWGLDGPFFLYVSRLEHPGKNHVRLIEAYERFRRTTGQRWLLVLGGSDWHGAEAIHAAARASEFAADIRLPGFIDDARLPDLYRAASALVYPSLFEGFGFPPLEAMACGCPVVCSDRGSLGEVIGDAAEVVDPLEAGSIAAGLSRLAGDADLRRRRVASGLANARRFDWDDAARRTVDVYRRAVARSMPH